MVGNLGAATIVRELTDLPIMLTIVSMYLIM